MVDALCGETSAVEARGLSKSYALWTSPAAWLRAHLAAGAARAPLLTQALRRRLERSAAHARVLFPALQDVSFDLARGETLAVIGRNGSGKSTLLQILAGTLAPSAGTATVRGRVAALLELGSGFNADFTGRENVLLGAALAGLSAPEAQARFDEIAAFADVGPFLDQPLRTYSSGMWLRLAFAVAAHVEPDVLIVDEALAVGDAGFQFKCFERMRRLTEKGAALVLVSHDMLTVRAFCRRALYLEAGRVKALGDVEPVSDRYFLDLRNEQRRDAGAGTALAPRAPLRAGAPLAFGGPEGRICDVRFLPQGGQAAAVARGESVAIEVELELQPGLDDPSVTLLLLSDRLLPVAGRRALLPSAAGGRFRLHFSFDARLAGGRYFVTVRAEQGRAPHTALLIEKQTAALELDVFDDSSEPVVGLFDLGIEVASEAQPLVTEALTEVAG